MATFTEFIYRKFKVFEILEHLVQYNVLSIFRGGSFGQLRVYYSTEVLSTVSDTPDNIANVLDYFSQPQLGSRGQTGQPVTVPAGSDPIPASI